MRTKTTEIICKVCGKPFVAKTTLAMYCPECGKITESRRAVERDRQKRAEARAKKNRKPNAEIVEMVKQATKMHLSYGEYVARYVHEPN